MSRLLRRLAVSGMCLGALAGFTACSPNSGPTGHAVGDEAVQVSLEDVDTATEALCSVQTRAEVRGPVRSTVAALVATRHLTDRFRAEHDLADQPSETATFNSQLGQLEAEGVEHPDEVARLLTARSRFLSTLGYAAAAQLAEQGTPIDLTDEEQANAAIQIGAATFQTWLGDQRVSFDPRLGLDGSTITLASSEGLNPLAYGTADVGSVAVAGDPAVAAAPLTAAQLCGPGDATEG